ncbi:hypothetical protein LXL04_016307 [Taraxacum kok-saghyz]
MVRNKADVRKRLAKIRNNAQVRKGYGSQLRIGSQSGLGSQQGQGYGSQLRIGSQFGLGSQQGQGSQQCTGSERLWFAV